MMDRIGVEKSAKYETLVIYLKYLLMQQEKILNYIPAEEITKILKALGEVK